MKKAGKNLIFYLVILIVVLNIIRVLLWYYKPFSTVALFSIVNRFDCMMIGAVGAILYHQKNIIFINIVNNKIAQFLALTLLLWIILNNKFVNAIVDTFVISIFTLVLIIGQINVKHRILNFDNKVFNFIGKISFGIYVYHPLLIFLFSLLFKSLIVDEKIKIFLAYASIITSTIIIAYLSYRFFESRFILMKNRFAVIKSTSSNYNDVSNFKNL